MSDAPYRGRFAPSPTGPLHFGSLVAALGCALEADAHGGKWFVRIEDLDTGRNVAGATRDILATLERLGFEWHGDVVHQCMRLDRYRAALDALQRGTRTFWCGCTRRETGKGPYPGTCRNGLPPGKSPRTLRFAVGDAVIAFEDRVQGAQAQALADAGDFVVLRADGIFAYQLAVCVDDIAAGITDIVRGADLLSSTGQQVALLDALGAPAPPRYAHLPVALHAVGGREVKLSKQTGAPPVDALPPAEALAAACGFLGQRPPPEMRTASVREAWAWMKANWDVSRVPREPGLAPL